MNFGKAIEALKQGQLVQREGWNGKGMHIYLEERMDLMFKHGAGRDRPRRYEPCIVLFTAQGNHQPGWNPSTPDVLAEDWKIVER